MMTLPRVMGLGLIALALGAIFLSATQQPAPTSPAPAPKPGPAPAPQPAPRPCPGPGPCPRDPQAAIRLPDAGGAPVGASVGGGRHADGTELACDLPGSLHLKNVGGSDGTGLCVFTSIAHSARWQNVSVLKDFRDWMRSKPGGGYPQKVDAMIARCAKERGQAVPAYLQVEGSDLGVLRAACRTGRMPGVTYSFSPTGRYGGARIAHMVSLVHADETHFVILDNNYPGKEGKEDTYEWLSADEFRRSYTGTGGGWSVVLLSAGPPPPPHN